MKLLNKLSNHANQKTLFISIILMVLFMGVILPLEASAYAEVSNGLSAPDTMIFYTADWLYELANQLGEAGRRYYIISRLRFDIAWPLVFTLFFFISMALLFKTSSKKRFLLILPILGLLFDFLENVLVSIVFMCYPNQTMLAHLAGVFTFLKWVFIVVTLIIIFTGVIIKGIISLKKARE